MTPCPDAERYFAHAEGALSPEEARALMAHLQGCGDCRARWDEIGAFDRALRQEALRARVRPLVPDDWGCPSPAQLADLFRGDLEGELASALQAHVATCPDCGAQMARMETALAALTAADPLAEGRPVPAGTVRGPQVRPAEPRWGAVARGRFVAAVELVVDAAAGATTRLQGLVRDAMVPAQSATLRPVPVVAMSPGAEPAGVTADEPLTDVQVETDAVAAELVSGAGEGGGTLTVLVEQQRAFAQRAPRVTLLAADGSVVAEAAAHLRGPRYRAVFPDLAPGTYLVAIE
jgi:anti-sigma factor RsiW